MNKTMLLTVTALLSLTVLTAQAGTRDPLVNKRQHHQMKRIGQGVKSGELTKFEARRLTKEQASIRKMERRMKADGRMTLKERAHLQKRLNHSSRHIYNEKHDDQTRP
ncbi:MAG TPA: hypothetical protein ENK26_10085 [Gammaproteobacteria bacterium]|nr:hypothetical protein [Gammaproteobacteria bacterium]